MDKSKIDRINKLAAKSKTTGLSEEEENERQVLRQEYIQNFKRNLKTTLDCTYVVDKQGNKTPLKKRHVKKSKH